MLLFRSEEQRTQEHVERWCKAWRLPLGATLSVEQAWKLADAWYRDRMSPEWRRRTVNEVHELFGSLGLTSEFWRFS
jgi:hypothetical protein